MTGHIDLGPCCACEATAGVRNIIMLHKLAPILGTGWGCVVCGLPCDGAIAVLCDGCVGAKRPARFAVFGLASERRRIPVADLADDFDHDLAKHRAHEALQSVHDRYWNRPIRAN
jgi:hypothetical protein